ncbi:flagellum-specific peptidoglycan hydrolase FlgJ [Aquimarina sp. MAR_2010_214]|uniref:glucosaminidase domain-containing protein n=1 Tax=Aquimarina sp. MAR_2010_214 TaxID=1250026 RepID=UPI000C712975|nr:glucosaminidase domain-containing protein [Aquimarina sp. MAR_2010_214]PKV52859.1 flagellum-specific peptidoglycan hydrolase FlgJ [Aquimarina sp. MAR_2010_214]
MRKFIVLLCIAMVMISCGGSKKVTSSRTRKPEPKPKQMVITKVERNSEKNRVEEHTTKKPLPVLSYNDKVQRYINEFSSIAKSEMKTYGIPASITLAQGILESGAGYGDLTQRARNHFGIKCHDWKGDRVYHDDDRSQECFRKYDRASESFRDHSLFLKDRKRYSRLFTFSQKDYKSWARGLREAGYATDKKYPQKLIAIIERYDLDKFDDEVLGTKPLRRSKKIEAVAVITSVSNKDGYTVKKGDTLYSISRRYKISVEELKAFNKLVNNNIAVGQVLKVAAADEEEEDFN